LKVEGIQPFSPSSRYNTQAIAQSDFFGLTIQSKSITNMLLTIQIRFSKWIDNPITIQLFLEKDIGQQTLNGQVL